MDNIAAERLLYTVITYVRVFRSGTIDVHEFGALWNYVQEWRACFDRCVVSDEFCVMYNFVCGTLC